MKPLLMLTIALLIGCADRVDIVDVPLRGLDNSEVSINRAENAVTIIYFLSPECPLCINYTLSMRNLEQKFRSDSVRFYGIYSKEWFSTEEVRTYQLRYKLEFEMLLDEGNRLANALGASVTPEVFVYNRTGEKIYSGKIDDWVNDLGKKKLEATKYYLDKAITAAIDSKPMRPNHTMPIGCLIE
jgi:peroxiredoxin